MPSRASAVRRFGTGVGYLWRGLRLWGTSPRLMLLGAIPAVVVGLVYVALFVLVILNLETVVGLATPFATAMADPWRSAIRALVGAALVGGAVLLGVFTFAAVTLAVGDPLYERIWRRTEIATGGVVPESGQPWWKSIGGSVRLLLLAALVGILLFLLGVIPVVGQVLAPVFGALVGGWILSLELTGFAFEARGIPLKERRRLLAASRATTLGFGVVTYLLFLVPILAVIVMPAAVAGATMLARDALPRGETKTGETGTQPGR